ncbi:hypothetical protein [Bacillus cereus group sp. TH260-2LC]|uniref:hypothetical protein n=1 Tax=unclassified Bacillus cereus group TaxID=2750818 RepID=UPI000DCA46FA|nr:hypothetical protein [Bacillus cereus group sp. TH260-2LC]MDA1531019.1 hypothetical protein [Bacillus cereus group sp. TH260-2LC]RAS94190.1 hypothetical protein A6E21_15570 [Bacillus cereus]
MSVKLQLSYDNEQIQFFNKEYGIVGFTDYTPTIWKDLSKVNWYVDEKMFVDHKKTYIYTGSGHFGARRDLHQIVMKLWYGDEAIETAYAKKYIIEHHNNNAFDCKIQNLSFASNDLNLTKAHSFDKNQPKLIRKAALNFYKDFKTQKYQITIICTDDFMIIQDGKAIQIERCYLTYEDNFRVVYTDANRIVDELLEVGNINFKLLSFKEFSYKEAEFYVPENGQVVGGIWFLEDEEGNPIMVAGEDVKGRFCFNSTPPNPKLYKKENK